jgi:hypothetical protein
MINGPGRQPPSNWLLGFFVSTGQGRFGPTGRLRHGRISFCFNAPFPIPGKQQPASGAAALRGPRVDDLPRVHI